jgi:predicted TIM-barrel fold metal-dependent hydrolase
MADGLAALACHGTLTRFPELRVASVENGSMWLPLVFQSLEEAYKRMPQKFTEDPIAAIRRTFRISPFWEDDLRALSEYLPFEHLLFGSDYPHPEGLADPLSYLDHLEGFHDSEIRKIMGENLAAIVA